jgi:endonuclease YncB( thermonuclease family)
MLVPLVAIAQTAPPAQPFQRLDGCAYKPQRWDDGDSFHVILPEQKEMIFRLYFVDTPEEERVYADRIAEQAAYFGISADAALEVGHEASEFTKRTLAKPFTIYTRWRRALGRSAILAILRNRRYGRRSRPERATCEQWTSANLRHANTVAGWSRFADIPSASA